MFMKGYSSEIPENCTCARLESVNASYKDLSEVCGRIRNKKTKWALQFLEDAAEGICPVLFRKHNKRLGHRKELGGRKGRYPQKAAGVVLKVLKSAIANGKVKGLGEEYTILSASANKKHTYPRIAPKGRWARSNLETSRVEIILKGGDIPKGVEVTPPKKSDEKKKEVKKDEKKPVKEEAKPKEEKAEAKEEKKEEPKAKEEKPKEEPKEEKKETEKKEPEKKEETEKEAPSKILKEEAKEHKEHKNIEEKSHEHEKRKEMPHQHGEHDKR